MEKRFVKILHERYSFGSATVSEIWVDTKTGVNYFIMLRAIPAA